MATETEVKTFIEKIAPLVQKYAKEYNYKVASPIIAQACLESAYGASILSSVYNNHFGMKCGGSWSGKSVNMQTQEEYEVGTLTNISANFRVYDSFEDGVKGYFDFIGYSRYANLKDATTPNEYLTLIKEDGYATSSTYVTNNMSIVNKYELTKYDNLDETVETVETVDIEELAKAVIRGEYGNGAERKIRLGELYDSVQEVVNAMLNSDNSTSEVTYREYTIQSGDTLSSIALNKLGDASRYVEIAEVNGIDNPNLIYAGDVIKLPN